MKASATTVYQGGTLEVRCYYISMAAAEGCAEEPTHHILTWQLCPKALRASSQGRRGECPAYLHQAQSLEHTALVAT